MTFRRYQSGSVLKRGKKGNQVWYGVFRQDVPQIEGGMARKQRFVRLGSVSEFPNRIMAKELLRQKMSAKPTPRTKFSELVECWRETVVPTIRESTATYYNKMLDYHLLPYFSVLEINGIGRYDVQKFLATKATRGFRKNTLKGMRVSLSRVLGWAFENKWIQENPCRGVKLPEAGTKVTRTILKPEQILEIAGELKEPYSTFVLFLAITGLRVGEATGVRWSDIEGNDLYIQRSIYEGKAGEVKSKSSRRILPLPDDLLARLGALGEGGYIFRTRNGSPLNPKNAAHRHLRPALKRVGIKLGGWHDFRHTFTTLSLKEHPLKAVSVALGHASTKITTDIYQHLDSEDLRAPLAGMSSKLLANVSKAGSLAVAAEAK